jgi:hypothetical protein
MPFFINVDTGQVATRAQLVEAGEAPAHEPPALPWHPVQGPGDASTALYSVWRKQVRGRKRNAWIGTLCIRHGDRQAFLDRDGWQEVSVDEIRKGPSSPFAVRSSPSVTGEPA